MRSLSNGHRRQLLLRLGVEILVFAALVALFFVMSNPSGGDIELLGGVQVR